MGDRTNLIHALRESADDPLINQFMDERTLLSAAQDLETMQRDIEFLLRQLSLLEYLQDRDGIEEAQQRYNFNPLS